MNNPESDNDPMNEIFKGTGATGDMMKIAMNVSTLAIKGIASFLSNPIVTVIAQNEHNKPLKEVTVALIGANGREQQMTAASGRAIFEGMKAGKYQVSVTYHDITEPHMDTILLKNGEETTLSITLEEQKFSPVSVPSIQPIAPIKPNTANKEVNRFAPPFERYLDHGDGTVTDAQTGLMWKRCLEGQYWKGAKCDGKAHEMKWYKAMPDGQQKTWPAFAGYDDWRVPTKDELLTLMYCSSGTPKMWNDTGEKCAGKYERPTLASSVFFITQTKNWRIWTASVSATSRAFYVDFYQGAVEEDRGYEQCILLVRSETRQQ